MEDWHVHIEKGPYTLEWLKEFVHYAEARKIKKICFVEHSHRFKEFADLYRTVIAHKGMGDYQARWLENKLKLSISDYCNLITQARKLAFPIELSFGLEVCYIPGEEAVIQSVLEDFDWDFATGSVHFIDGWGFDHKESISVWNTVNVAEVYKRYYEIMENLIESELFTVLAHPDSIKCLGYVSDLDLSPTYQEIAVALKAKNMKVEFSNGLHINYGLRCP